MTRLLEIKDKIVQIYSKGETYFNMAFKFLAALALFFLINFNIGYMDKISNVPVALVLALICCLLPQSATLWIAAVLILVDLYALTMEAAIIGLLLFAILYFLYFRFCPKDNAIAVLTPIAYKLNVPYVMTMPAGLLRPAHSALSICCATVAYYYLDGVRQNASAITTIGGEEVTTGEKLTVLVGIILNNKEMYLAMIAMGLATLLVYFLRRLKTDYAWTIATIAGALVQGIVMVVGSLLLSVQIHIISLLVGTALAVGLGLLLQFFVMNLDYERVENVQFEDDDYYYYVKAVPKKIVPAREKTVKQFGATGKLPRTKGAKKKVTDETAAINSKDLAKELDIDETLLKK